MDPKDETKGKEGDSLLNGQTSAQTDGTTSKVEPKLLTEEQAQKMVSDALAKAGRDAKALDSTRQELARMKAEAQQIIKDKEEEERKAVQSDPAKLSAFEMRKRERELEDQRRVLEETKARLESDVEEDRKLARLYRRNVLTSTVASEYEGIDMAKYQSLCENLGESPTKGQIEKIAQALGTKKGETPSGNNPLPKQASGRDEGTPIDYSKLSPEEKIRLGIEQEKLKRK
jgi:hypothetical protein